MKYRFLSGLRKPVALAILLCVPAVALAQDRDVSAGSTSGSIRPDVLDVQRVPRAQTLSPERRAHLVAEFDSWRGVEALLNAPTFEALKADYRSTLEKAAAVTKELTPDKYLLFEVIARGLVSERSSVGTAQLAKDMINSYMETGDFRRPVLSAGFSRSEIKQAQSAAAATIKRARKSVARP